MPSLLLPFADPPPATDPAAWEDPPWATAPAGELVHFRPEGSGHRPRTRVKCLRSRLGLHGLFLVEDRHVRSVRTRTGDPVYRDSCVEFFVAPRPGAGYFHFEFNAGGAMLAGFVTDPTRTPDGGILGGALLDGEEARLVAVRSSLPAVVDPEIGEPTIWSLAFSLPYSLLERRAGTLALEAGAVWRGNFFKCADETSRPHWASWTELPARNFHLPECFGELVFAAIPPCREPVP